MAEAATGEAGLAEAHFRSQPDIVILDLGLPDIMDGLTVLKRLRESEPEHRFLSCPVRGRE